MQRIYLTAPLWYEVVGLHLDQGEKLLRYQKLATSSRLEHHRLGDAGSGKEQEQLLENLLIPSDFVVGEKPV